MTLASLALAGYLAATPSPGHASWREAAIARIPDSELPRALTTGRAQVEQWPRDCSARHQLALLEARSGDLDTALTQLWRVTRTCRDQPAALYDLGRLELERGCHSEAMTALERALLLAPGDDRLRRLTMMTSEQLGRRHAAVDRRLAALERAIELGLAEHEEKPAMVAEWRWLEAELNDSNRSSPNDPEVKLRQSELMRIGGELALVDGDVAVRLAREAVNLRDTWPAAHILVGTLELTATTTRSAAAERSFLNALSVSSDTPEPAALTGLFFVYLATDRIGLAGVAAADYGRLVPDDHALTQLLRSAVDKPEN